MKPLGLSTMWLIYLCDVEVNLLPPANVVCEGYVFTGVCLSTGRGGIPACLAGHITRQQYISRCTVDVSQLVWRQHTGNIKCMMGYVTWYTPLLWEQ